MNAQMQRDIAIDRADQAAPEKWKETALQLVHRLARIKDTLTTDDLWELLDHPPEPRAMGAIMRRASKNGWIQPTNMIVNSKRPQCHARALRVWRSQIAS